MKIYNANHITVAKATRLKSGEMILERLAKNGDEWVTLPGTWDYPALIAIQRLLYEVKGIPSWEGFWKKNATRIQREFAK